MATLPGIGDRSEPASARLTYLHGTNVCCRESSPFSTMVCDHAPTPVRCLVCFGGLHSGSLFNYHERPAARFQEKTIRKSPAQLPAIVVQRIGQGEGWPNLSASMASGRQETPRIPQMGSEWRRLDHRGGSPSRIETTV